MSITIYLKCKREQIDSLKPLYSRFKEYLQVHAPPMDESYCFEIGLCKSTELFEWAWPDELDSVNKCVWQGMCDKWLREQFPRPLFSESKSVYICARKNDTMSNETSTKNDLIKGEGLATFTSQVPRWKMSDLILPPALCEQMENAISVSKYSDLIYTTWGFSEIEPQPRAVLNFYGAPGTGKTMAAHCIANELGKKIIVANFAEIESKYVGDSPKNLENIFSVAKAEDAVLFFDEADSFLGRRITAISSSSDQAVNSLRSKLLQLLEEHTGIVIFSTNLLKNYDKAFDSRILFNLQFELPDLECRKKLIRQKIPRKLPFECDKGIDDSVIMQLAEITEGFSGREIKNAVLQVLCRVASESRRVFSSSDFVEGFTRKKEEIEKIKKERNEFDPQRKAQIGKCIEENLTKGNFSVKASSNQ